MEEGIEAYISVSRYWDKSWGEYVPAILFLRNTTNDSLYVKIEILADKTHYVVPPPGSAYGSIEIKPNRWYMLYFIMEFDEKRTQNIYAIIYEPSPYEEKVYYEGSVDVKNYTDYKLPLLLFGISLGLLSLSTIYKQKESMHEFFSRRTNYT